MHYIFADTQAIVHLTTLFIVKTLIFDTAKMDMGDDHLITSDDQPLGSKDFSCLTQLTALTNLNPEK